MGRANYKQGGREARWTRTFVDGDACEVSVNVSTPTILSQSGDTAVVVLKPDLGAFTTRNTWRNRDYYFGRISVSRNLSLIAKQQWPDVLLPLHLIVGSSARTMV